MCYFDGTLDNGEVSFTILSGRFIRFYFFVCLKCPETNDADSVSTSGRTNLLTSTILWRLPLALASILVGLAGPAIAKALLAAATSTPKVAWEPRFEMAAS